MGAENDHKKPVGRLLDTACSDLFGFASVVDDEQITRILCHGKNEIEDERNCY